MELAQPEHLGTLFAALLALFVLPMSCNTEFGASMHLKGANLNLNCFAIWSNDRCMQRLIEIEFRHSDVILEAARNWTPTRMDRTEYCVTIADVIY